MSAERPIFPEEDDSARAVSDSAPREDGDRQDDEEGKQATKAAAATGAAVGAVAGAVVLGPLGAVAGGALGAAVGAANTADADDPSSTGNITDDDQNRVKRTYSGRIYEEGSLADVRRQDEI